MGKEKNSCRPTVIIDEKSIERDVQGGHVFNGVVGVDVSPKGFIGFKTWNGSKPIYLFDENEELAGITTKDEMGEGTGFFFPEEMDRGSSFSNPKKKRKNRKKNRRARASRKANRRKKQECARRCKSLSPSREPAPSSRANR